MKRHVNKIQFLLRDVKNKNIYNNSGALSNTYKGKISGTDKFRNTINNLRKEENLFKSSTPEKVTQFS